ncbi:hypothetical protein GCM10010350_77030 [Streptomyces galilaeus]|nr:hypothetical protein GCM10010350_77030 [Streptomyces galilaeus]
MSVLIPEARAGSAGSRKTTVIHQGASARAVLAAARLGSVEAFTGRLLAVRVGRGQVTASAAGSSGAVRGVVGMVGEAAVSRATPLIGGHYRPWAGRT